MKKAILIRKSEYDRGSYTIKGGGYFDGQTIFDYMKNGVVKDLKNEGFKVFENDWITPEGTFVRQEVLKQI